MKRHDKQLLRMAGLIHRQLAPPATGPADELGYAFHRFQLTYHSLEAAGRMIDKARQRGWHEAARLMKDQFQRTVRQLAAELSSLQQQPPHTRRPGPPTLGMIVEELRQLFDEFDAVQVKNKEGKVIITTSPIELQGLHLGRFAIELHILRLGPRADSSCFDILALDPNPAGCNSEVTHPHVRGEALCAGDATVPLHQALVQGRLADAFCLVRAVLNTYNPHSPHVSIQDWNGVRCPDCEDLVNEDELFTCEPCGRQACSGCMSSCDICGQYTCRSCLERDRVSHQDCCPHCPPSPMPIPSRLFLPVSIRSRFGG